MPGAEVWLQTHTCFRSSLPKALTVSSHSAGAPGTVTHSALPGGSSGPPMPLFLTSCAQLHSSLSSPTLAHAPESDVLRRNTSKYAAEVLRSLFTSRVRPAGERPQPSMAVTFLEDAS